MQLVQVPIPASSASRRISRVSPRHEISPQHLNLNHHHHHHQPPIYTKAPAPRPGVSHFSPPPLSGMYPQYLQQNSLPLNRRTPSNATSNSSQSGQPGIRRSSSNKSQNPSSYVALLRKQKATVWCDRSQAEDPRIAAAIRRAKERAEREVVAKPGGLRITPPSSHSGSFTSGVAKKIRHHGAPKTTQFGGGNMAGMGVPLRFSATEVDDEDEANEEWGAGPDYYGASNRSSDAHRRSTSGRLNTMDRFSASDLGGGGSTGHHSRTPSDLPPIPNEKLLPVVPSTSITGNKSYFTSPTTNRKDSEADVSPNTNDKDVEDETDLKRRGSVDDRAMTMGGVRLFVANPDLDD
jgi:hypothetical protein